MKRFLGYTRDSRGKFLNRHIQTIANTVHRSTGGGRHDGLLCHNHPTA